jgi:phage baseplate assembly protein W
VKPSPNILEALGIDFEPLGNEGRLLFGWPAVRDAEGHLYLAETADHGSPSPLLEEESLSDMVELLPSPTSIKPGFGFLVIGPRWIENAHRMDDLLMDWMIKLIQLQTVEVNQGFQALPLTRHGYLEVARHFGSQALRVFDEAVSETRAARITEKAEAAFKVLNVESTLPYEARVMRRLLYFRIKKDHERLRTVLETAVERLNISQETLIEDLIDTYDVLKETRPFEKAAIQQTQNFRGKAGTSELIEEMTMEMEVGNSFTKSFDPAFSSSGFNAQPFEQEQRGLEEKEDALLQAFVRLGAINKRD